MSDEAMRNIRLVLADRYEALVVFFGAAAKDGRAGNTCGPAA
ncbi:hypothetical protein [Micromonospora sp. NBC_01638]|nr:hypothetical protein OG811_23440 [Micromonospora sp. NBC_01638]